MSPQFANIHVISFECGVDTIQKCNVPALNGHTSLITCMLLSRTERESLYARLYGPNFCTHPVHYRKYFRMSHTAHYQRTAAMFFCPLSGRDSYHTRPPHSMSYIDLFSHYFTCTNSLLELLGDVPFRAPCKWQQWVFH